MTRAIALLRAVNVAGHGRLAMADLRAVAESLGWGEAQTVLQSGNLVFLPPARARLDSELAGALRRQLGFDTDVFVRTAPEWNSILAGNPFPREAKADPARLLVMVLHDAPGAARERALRQAVDGPEQVRVIGRTAYLAYPAGIGQSKLTTARIERALATRGTARNWNTARKLGEMLCAGA